MAIAPPSDLVLDVARAADPGSLRGATQRLERIAATGDGEATSFRALVEPARSMFAPTGAARSADARNTSPAHKFEALVLHQFVETMLPDDASAVFGEGSTGEIWKSMLAEQVADQMASSGGIGIADLLTDTLNKGSIA